MMAVILFFFVNILSDSVFFVNICVILFFCEYFMCAYLDQKKFISDVVTEYEFQINQAVSI